MGNIKDEIEDRFESLVMEYYDDLKEFGFDGHMIDFSDVNLDDMEALLVWVRERNRLNRMAVLTAAAKKHSHPEARHISLFTPEQLVGQERFKMCEFCGNCNPNVKGCDGCDVGFKEYIMVNVEE